MLEIIEQRKGILEFYDSEYQQERESQIRKMYLLYILIIVFFILCFATILSPYSLGIKIPLIIIFIAVIVLSLFKVRNSYLGEYDISSFTLTIDPDEDVTKMIVNYWMSEKSADIRMEDIRFNQSVGYRAVMDINGSIDLEIIVHEEYPGDAIFTTNSIETLADLYRCLMIIFPDKQELYLINYDRGPWDGEDTILWEQELQNTRIPPLLREYYKY